jgi:hypothetical protein
MKDDVRSAKGKVLRQLRSRTIAPLNHCTLAPLHHGTMAPLTKDEGRWAIGDGKRAKPDAIFLSTFSFPFSTFPVPLT